ncbi:S8 family peptidase [Mucilaginibacter sp. McL0603]|uniref:S8 family peptidase n=1 Tax=Mucilaginibacter sp. McL0603 TaxID=3415670 RepID=UPI003CE8AF3F
MKNLFPVKKLIVAISICLPICSQAQVAQKAKKNWQNLDLKTDTVFGISTEKAYNELLKDKKHVTVVVAVIDGGVDINHEDLKQVIWINTAETASNNTDDDKNGYVDDIHGWDFIGSVNGDEHFDNTELVRFVHLYTMEFKGKDTTALKGKELTDFYAYQKMRNDLADKVKKARRTYTIITNFNEMLKDMLPKMSKSDPGLTDFQNYEPQNNREVYVKKIMVENLGKYKDLADFRKNEIDDALKHFSERLNYHYNIDYDPRSIVGDNYTDSSEHFYGNNDVTGPDADHGTHVSGIIGAVRDNDLGVMGVANDVRIMSVRTIPNGDERDKDVANAIRYAANNGAKVINMSFGKSYSYDKKAVDEAVKIAMSKDVLIIHSAGNDGQNNDIEQHFPNRTYEDKSGVAEAWIEVGASGIKDDKNLKAFFSDYGKNSVDVFAPGMEINSTTPNSTYTVHDGTSMAAPVVTGLAALIRSYYPKLTALQVKEIILKSVVKVQHKVIVKDGESEHKVPFEDICITGGIVNAYEALKLAATYQ